MTVASTLAHNPSTGYSRGDCCKKTPIDLRTKRPSLRTSPCSIRPKRTALAINAASLREPMRSKLSSTIKSSYALASSHLSQSSLNVLAFVRARAEKANETDKTVEERLEERTFQHFYDLYETAKAAGKRQKAPEVRAEVVKLLSAPTLTEQELRNIGVNANGPNRSLQNSPVPCPEQGPRTRRLGRVHSTPRRQSCDPSRDTRFRRREAVFDMDLHLGRLRWAVEPVTGAHAARNP